MSQKIAINGFGRIGRCVLRSIYERNLQNDIEIVAINEELEDAPETVNNDAYGDGWLFRIKASEESELDNLLDAEGYAHTIDED